MKSIISPKPEHYPLMSSMDRLVVPACPVAPGLYSISTYECYIVHDIRRGMHVCVHITHAPVCFISNITVKRYQLS